MDEHLIIDSEAEEPAIGEIHLDLFDRLALPPFLEPRRAEIEAKLKPL